MGKPPYLLSQADLPGKRPGRFVCGLPLPEQTQIPLGEDI